MPGTLSAPGGLLGPAAFPFAAVTANDAPPVTRQPYLIAAGMSSNQTTLNTTLPVQNPTSTGDAIILITAADTSSNPGGTNGYDTQNNTYSDVQLDNQGFVHGGMSVAPNPTPLGYADSVSWAGIHPNTQKNLVAVGIPAAAYPGTPAGSYLTFDPAATFSGYNVTPALVTAGSFRFTQPRLLIAAFITNNIAGPPAFGQDWTTFATYLDNTLTPGNIGTSGYYIVVAWKYQLAKTATVNPVAWSMQSGSPGNAGAMVLVQALMPETRFGRRPDMPPGLTSPGAWQHRLPAFPGPQPGPAYVSENVAPADSATFTDVAQGVTAHTADSAQLADSATVRLPDYAVITTSSQPPRWTAKIVPPRWGVGP